MLTSTHFKDRAFTLRNRLVASDPGYQQLRMAGRATAAALLALGILMGLGYLIHPPLQATMLCVMIAMMSSVVVNDNGPRRQRNTTFLLAPITAVTIFLGTLMTGRPISSKVVFLFVLFVAVYVRRYGPRGLAFGMLGFITYFFALFLHATVALLPWLMAAVVLGLTCNFVIRFVVFKPSPSWRVKHLLRSYFARVDCFFDELAQAISSGQSNDRRLRRQILKLNEISLMIEDELDDISYLGEQDDLAVTNPLLILFDIELTANRLAMMTKNEVSGVNQPLILKAIQHLHQCIKKPDTMASEIKINIIEQVEADRWVSVLRSMAVSLQKVPNIKQIKQFIETSKTESQEADVLEGTNTSINREMKLALRFTTRQAIQVTAASAQATIHTNDNSSACDTSIWKADTESQALHCLQRIDQLIINFADDISRHQ